MLTRINNLHAVNHGAKKQVRGVNDVFKTLHRIRYLPISKYKTKLISSKIAEQT